MKTTAIVLAGGSGSRMKTKTKKQYLLVEGKPVLWYSLHAFEESPLIDAVILVCGAGEVQHVGNSLSKNLVFARLRRLLQAEKSAIILFMRDYWRHTGAIWC